MNIQEIVDPHVIIALCCIVGAVCISGGLIIWLAIECEYMGKR